MKELVRKNLKVIPFMLFGLMGVAPILMAIGAGLVAKVHGYELHEGYPPDDSDLARTLYRLGAAGWYFLVTFPAAVGLSGIYAAFLFVLPRMKGRGRPLLGTNQGAAPNRSAAPISKSESSSRDPEG
jgi:hypothetical protein